MKWRIALGCLILVSGCATTTGEDLGMALVPAGKYPIGTEFGLPNEAPRRTFSLERGILMDVGEVTRGRYRTFLDKTKSTPPPSWANDPMIKLIAKKGFAKLSLEELEKYKAWASHPVTDVSFHDAERFATWEKKRLPTEEEWEAAARGVQGAKFPWGDTHDRWASNSGDSGGAGPLPIGSYPRGRAVFGHLDLAGNVWEWTATKPKQSNTQGKKKEIRVIKGGSYDPYENPPRSSKRRFLGVNERRPNLGFRCVKEVKGPTRP